ncbi:MAG: BBP7 family outer membrane beta-barrel protein [Pirellulaceae bacterium]
MFVTSTPGAVLMRLNFTLCIASALLVVCCNDAFSEDRLIDRQPIDDEASLQFSNDRVYYNDAPLIHGHYNAWVNVTADAIFLTHSDSAFRSEILDPGNGTVTVAQDLEHGFPVAPRLRIGTLLLDSFRTELSYFGTDGWNSSAQIRNVAPFPDLAADIDYEAQLHNIEWNFISGPSEIDAHWLIGVRYLNYQDSFLESYRLDPGFGPLITETAQGEAENSAFGPQIGVGLDLGGGTTFLQLGGKLGLMNNRVTQTGAAYDTALTIDGNPETRFSNRSDEFAWLGELSVTLNHFVTRSLSLRMGYQGLFLDNVAQSARQNGRQAMAEQISFHGAVFGLQWSR